MASLLRSLSQRFRRSKRPHYHQGAAAAAGTSAYQQVKKHSLPKFLFEDFPVKFQISWNLFTHFNKFFIIIYFANDGYCMR
ncbi:unnamed protein product [Gongylonema pulchrum]|uniref:Uncharacterized protein n=1 Tax=Gongylonema pulchrum TaxID=637853 RepID=A0A183ELJ2_9BILA|nr:unnamed protein product [Gongylonema pulchrum]